MPRDVLPSNYKIDYSLTEVRNKRLQLVITPSLNDRVREVANKESISVNELCNRILTKGLDECEKEDRSNDAMGGKNIGLNASLSACKTQLSIIKDDKARQYLREKILVLNFLTSATENMICELVNSSVFNDIFLCYVKCALNRLKMSEEEQSRVLSAVTTSLSELRAGDAIAQSECV